MDRSIVLGAKCPICGADVERRLSGFPGPTVKVTYACKNLLCGFHIGGGPVLENAIGAAWQLLEGYKELREVQQHENKSD